MSPISKRATVLGGAVAVATLIGVAGVSSAVASASDTTADPAPTVTVTVTADPLPAVTVTADPLPAVTVTVTRTRTITAAPEPTATITRRVTGEAPPGRRGSFTAGTWKVGAEIPAGTYVTNLAGGEHCYYARLSGFGGDFDEIIANDNYEGPARGRVTVAAADAGIEFSGDCVWSPA